MPSLLLARVTGDFGQTNQPRQRINTFVTAERVNVGNFNGRVGECIKQLLGLI